MPDNKRIALFLDGTWNTVNDNTNVWRMKSLCLNGPDQVCYYSAGVGTAYGQKISGGMFGYGLDQEIIQAYLWLVEHYNQGDQVYIFGFSRGAFTARALSGLISKCGLLKAGSPLSVNQLYARYRKGNATTIRGLEHVPVEKLTLEERWLKAYSIPIAIWFIGVWDTVGALGVPFGHIPVISRSDYGFLETDQRIDNDSAYHALAIDEHREAFAPTLWTRTTAKNAQPNEAYPPRPLDQVEQRWFVGAHANVGGGYADDLLAQIPLEWLMQKAKLRGLIFKSDVVIDGNENKATINDSFAEMAGGVYRLMKLYQPYYRPIGASPIEANDKITATINETIDASVFDRWRNDTTYRPKNLTAWAQGHDINIESLNDSVRADDPSC